ncbi:hypothetical protein [Streptomyces sp. NBC_00620]|uniref:SCO2400 family protein n=1 Tax=Streptomyces sp. NBC_00620 TaxID=2903666 RepID=UPI00225081EE|nr:hypothetical protein [Streptomyces sp. NBC_00620]MCX4976299.1 hypothetical protein [Streptomyces sp. NBC_00620]
MDYCSDCRRHLNGALACPGCGAYAPSIAPLADGTPATVTAGWQAPSQLWHNAEPDAEEFDEAPQEHPYNGPDSPFPTPTGRAARRRQRERWRKTQRRALVATAVALVGGGLTVSLTDQQSTDRAQAASAPDREAMGIAEEQVTEPTPASSTPTETRPSQRTSSATPSSTATTANAPHEQSAAAPQATPTTQQAGGTTPLATAASAAESQADSTVSDATDTATGTAASPTPSATDSTGTSSTDTSSATSSPSDSSSPSGLCLLGLVCIS